MGRIFFKEGAAVEPNNTWQSRVENKHYSVAYIDCVTVLKHCSAVLPLRAGLIRVAELHQCLISLYSTYEPCP